MSVNPKEKKVAKTRVISIIKDWKKRLDALFGKIETWGQPLSSAYRMEVGEIVQINEELMRRFGVAPRKLPTFSIV